MVDAASEGVVDLLQYTSPAIAAQQALNALVGTGNERFEDFVAQVTRFHDNWRGFFVSKIVKSQRMMAADFDAIPVFAYAPASAHTARAPAFGPLIFLSLVIVILVAANQPRR